MFVIRVSKITDGQKDSYGTCTYSENQVYEQKVEELDLQKLILAIFLANTGECE